MKLLLHKKQVQKFPSAQKHDRDWAQDALSAVYEMNLWQEQAASFKTAARSFLQSKFSVG